MRQLEIYTLEAMKEFLILFKNEMMPDICFKIRQEEEGDEHVNGAGLAM